MEEEIDVSALARPADMQELLERIRREWDRLLSAVEGITPEQASRLGPGGWAVKDNLAHLAAWEQMMLRSYLRGEPQHEVVEVDEAEFAHLDEDAINAIFYARNKDLPPEEVLRVVKRSHTQVVETLERLPFDELLKARFPDDPEKRPMLDWVTGNTYEHYQEHRGYIQEILSHGG